MARYWKAMSSALWMQLASVVCYALNLTSSTLVIIWRTYSLDLLVSAGITVIRKSDPFNVFKVHLKPVPLPAGRLVK